MYATADLVDAREAILQSCALPFRSFGGATFSSGDWLYADEDGLRGEPEGADPAVTQVPSLRAEGEATPGRTTQSCQVALGVASLRSQ